MVLPDRGDGIVVLTNSDAGSAFCLDVMCAWSRATTSREPPRCQARSRDRTIGAVLTVVLGVLVGGYVLRLALQLGRRRRIWGLDRQRLGRRIAARVIVVVVAVAWWLVWHTDVPGQLVMERPGDVLPDPVAPFGALISRLFLLGCALVVVAGLATRRLAGQGRASTSRARPARSALDDQP
jgi:hypothetical protein